MLNARDITLGQYYPGQSAVHRMDPRVKILLLIVFITAVFLPDDLYGLIFSGLWLVAACRASKLPFSLLVKGLKPLRVILIFTFVLNVFFSSDKEGALLFDLGFVSVTQTAFLNALRYLLRLVLLVMGSSMLTLTTPPVTLTDGMERLLSPLRVFHFPAHELAMMMTIALRFIPTLLEEAEKIMKAQTARGADFESGKLLSRAKAMVPLLVPLFVSSFRRAGDLAMAMEARCYRGGEGRTRLHVLKVGKNDYLAMAVTGFMLGLVIAQKVIF